MDMAAHTASRWVCVILQGLMVFALAGAAAPARAEQRALIVGLGRYDIPEISLPSIDLDVDRVHAMLNMMGFQDRQIHILQDEAATSSAVIAEFSGWLKQGVQPNDRVVFYFSGHGSNVPDFEGEEDNDVSQVLVTYDVKRVRVQGKPSLSGVLVDTRISQLLAAIPSKNILFIADSCHSGTVTRAIKLTNHSLDSGPVFVKSFDYPGMPVSAKMATRAVNVREPKWDPKVNYVALTAAADTQEAIGTSKGGMFTIGLTEAVQRRVDAGQSITLKDLRAETEDYIRSKTDKDQTFTPQLTGNPTLADAALKVAAPGSDGPNRKRLLELAAAQPQHFELTASKAQYAIDEPVTLSFAIPAAGYLNVVTVDAKDNALVLFPNRYQQDNAVTAGAFTVPTPKMGFDLLASPPTGPTLVVAFVSSEAINFYQETADDRDENGFIKVDFSSLSPSATRAIRIAPRNSQRYAAQLQLQIAEAAAGH
jgi:metacaspase-1